MVNRNSEQVVELQKKIEELTLALEERSSEVAVFVDALSVKDQELSEQATALEAARRDIAKKGFFFLTRD